MQLKYHMVTIEDLVPENHFLRKVERSLDLSFVYEETAHLYSRRYGRPPIDPLVIVKYLFLGFFTASHQSVKWKKGAQTATHFVGIYVLTWMNGCRTTVQSASCGGNQRFRKSSGGCLRKWCESA